MPASLFCRQCLGRLPRHHGFRPGPQAQSQVRARLHTQLATAAPTTTNIFSEDLEYPQPASYSGRTQNGSGTTDSAENRRGQEPDLGRTASHYGDLTKPTASNSWKGELKKFVPAVRAHSVGLQGPAQNLRDLKAKLFTANGRFDRISDDIQRWYKLSDAELRQTLSQLGRLLWGESTEGAAAKIDQFHIWKLDFAHYMSQIGDANPSVDFHDPNIKEMVDLLAENYTLFEAFWHRLDHTKRKLLWPRMVGCAMSMRPAPLLALVRATFTPDSCPNYILEDIVHFLDQYSRVWDTPAMADSRNDATKAAEFLLRHAPYRYIQLSQNSLLQVMQRQSHERNPNRVWEYYEKSKELGQHYTQHTLLHVASRLAKSPTQKARVLEVFRHLKTLPGFDINAPEPASVCTTLLTIQKDGPLPEGQAEPDHLFKSLLDMGLNPNLIGWSALMHNFCARGHLDTGWKVFDMMCQRGVQPDATALAILMHRSKLDRNIPSARNVLRVAMASNTWSPGLINNFLGTLFYANEDQILGGRQRKSNSAWRPMVQLYSKFFDLAPLQQLTMFPLENIVVSRGALRGHDTELTDMAASIKPLRDSELMQPDTNTLMLMFTAHMRSIRNPIALRRYYRLFQRLQEQEHPPSLFVRLLQDHGTRVHDVFVQALMQFRASIPYALDIVLKMVRRGSFALKDEKRRWKYQPPSVHTWTILMNGFKNHREATDAMRILDLMTRIGGVQPSSATWNILLAAYAKQGSLATIVDIVSCLEAAGHDGSSERTFESFRFLRPQDRGRIVELLDARRTELAATAAVQSFDRKEPSDGRLSEPERKRRIQNLIARVLGRYELAESTGRASHTRGSTDLELATMTFERMKKRWKALGAARRPSGKMDYKHANALWRQRQAAKRTERF
ncbi:uncharacterized protein B0I36DRAFT_330318 [Microdochium trichocladiopsis]|uniref:Pentatricopeptide repeat protein n=1 Tax=Microdochium trichocladiopsis TaxID=1682393 RepID=A0A9P8Y2D6_9PEZI|nr:uncharacterized protein B0I36DRAFT_330318 [Microdochium trichocladiopsis]KAH7026294.1 hypothetical protein B0I36DRAFT_330318 [Microdochium trichocladiopsis]